MAAGVAGADERGIDLYQAFHDYEDGASGSYPDIGPVSDRGGYETLMVLDEAYHDYDEGTAMKSNALLETATIEIAAFEEIRIFTDSVPWELQVND